MSTQPAQNTGAPTQTTGAPQPAPKKEEPPKSAVPCEIKHCDMKDPVKKFATEACILAINGSDNTQTIAKDVTDRMIMQYGGRWHAAVGLKEHNYGTYVYHNNDMYIRLVVGKYCITLWQTK